MLNESVFCHIGLVVGCFNVVWLVDKVRIFIGILHFADGHPSRVILLCLGLQWLEADLLVLLGRRSVVVGLPNIIILTI